MAFIIKANITGVVAGLGYFMALLWRYWHVWEGYIIRTETGRKALACALIIRCVQSVITITMLLLDLHYIDFLQWIMFADLLSGFFALNLFSSVFKTFSLTFISSFFATLTQGILLIIVIMTVMVLSAAILALINE